MKLSIRLFVMTMVGGCFIHYSLHAGQETEATHEAAKRKLQTALFYHTGSPKSRSIIRAAQSDCGEAKKKLRASAPTPEQEKARALKQWNDQKTGVLARIGCMSPQAFRMFYENIEQERKALSDDQRSQNYDRLKLEHLLGQVAAIIKEGGSFSKNNFSDGKENPTKWRTNAYDILDETYCLFLPLYNELSQENPLKSKDESMALLIGRSSILQGAYPPTLLKYLLLRLNQNP